MAVYILAPLLWCYALVQAFVFDLDSYALGRISPHVAWVVKYKVLLFLAALALVLMRRKRSSVVVSILFVVFYPIVVVGYLAYLIFKQRSWNLAIALVNSVIVFFRSFRYNAVIFCVYIIFAAFLVVSSLKSLVWTSIAAVLAMLLAVYLRSIVFALRPSGAFEVYQGLSSWLRRRIVPSWSLDEEMRSLTIQQFNEIQLNKWQTNLQLTVLTNRIFLAAAKRLKQYQSSGLNIVSYVFTIFLLFVFTICSFAVVNWGLFRVDPGEFTIVGRPSLFLFSYYSFNSLFYRSIAEVVPSHPVAQTLLMLEFLCAMFLVVILVTLFFTVKNQKYARELEDAMNGIRAEGDAIEGLIRSEYRIDNVEAAIRELEGMQVKVMGLIYSMSKYL